MCYSIHVLIHFCSSTASWLLLAPSSTETPHERHCLHLCSLSTTCSRTLKSHQLKQVYTRDCTIKGVFDDRSKATSVCCSTVCSEWSPSSGISIQQQASLFVPLLSRSEPHRKSDSSLQRETKTPSFIFHNLEPFKSLCFLFLFLPIMPSKMSPLYVMIGGWFHKYEFHWSVGMSFSSETKMNQKAAQSEVCLVVNVKSLSPCCRLPHSWELFPMSQSVSLIVTTDTTCLFCSLLKIFLNE